MLKLYVTLLEIIEFYVINKSRFVVETYDRFYY